MSFWSTLGRAALTAAPYVAAPFTGGTSLYFAPAASAAAGAWAQRENAQRATQGLGPSRADQIISMAGQVAPSVAGAGGFGAAAASGANRAGTGWMGAVNQAAPMVANATINSGNGGGGQSYGPAKSNNGIGPSMGPVMPAGGFSYQNNPMNQSNQNNPNLAASIFQGRQEAIRNQPFRSGYDVQHLGSDDETPMTSRMPQIYDSNYGSDKKDPVVNKPQRTATKRKSAS